MASTPAPKKAPPISTKPASRKKAAGAAVPAPKNVAASAKLVKAKAVKRQKPVNPPAKPGRPSLYTPELAAAICEHIAEAKTLRAIAAMKGMPHQSTILSWLDGRQPSFSEQYARAREAQADKLAEETLAIADEECTMVRADKHGSRDEDGQGNTEVVFDATAVARNRLRVDARKWLASKMAPKKYGDKVHNEHTGADGGAIQVASTVTFVRPPARSMDDT